MSNKKRFVWMRKRHKFLYDIAKIYDSLEEFIKDKDEWFALVGNKLSLNDDFVTVEMYLDYGEYESYYKIPDGKGRLTVSEIIKWQDNCFANSIFNIFSLKGAEEEEILTAIHDYSPT